MCRHVVVLSFLVACPLVLAQQTLNNDSLVKLRKAGFSEDVIVSTINRSPGTYDTSVDGLIALKEAGVTNPEISAVMAKASAGPLTQAAPALSASAPPLAVRTALHVPAHAVSKPRVFLRAESHGEGWTASRDQSMEMSKDFTEVCPHVQISVNPHLVDYTVELNHSEHGFVRSNQMQVANQDGDLISRVKDGGSIKGDVKKACDAILDNWAGK